MQCWVWNLLATAVCQVLIVVLPCNATELPHMILGSIHLYLYLSSSLLLIVLHSDCTLGLFF
jgi:hypothetical protein